LRTVRALLALVALALTSASVPAPPKRIVSLNLCADQYLIALADPDQIAGLSQFARDPALSFYADRARSFPIASRSAERILLLKPDLVVGVPFRQREALVSLKARGVPMVDLPRKDGLDGIEKSITLIAEKVGHPERGRALIASIRARVAQVGPAPGKGRVAAYYQRQGFLTGTGTLVDDMMTRLGLVNLARRLKLPPLSRLSIEQMAIAHPDFLILESATAKVTDQGTEMLHHPLLDSVVAPAHHLYVPQALTVCGGPSYPAALEFLAARLRAADKIKPAH
jgi:iron complex transport system substrate-binding protein